MSEPLEYLPVFLQMRERQAVVIGGGLMAARKAEWLLRAGAAVRIISPALHAETRALVDARLGTVTVQAREFVPVDLEGATLAVAATDDHAINQSVAAEAHARGIPVNVVDDAASSSFIFPAIIDRSPVIVAVGSGGSSPVLARRIRAQIEALLPARLGALAQFARRHRARVKQILRADRRRAFWERIFAGPVASRVLEGSDPALADAALTRNLQAFAGAAPCDTGKVWLIGAGPGDPELLTLRAVQLLQLADVILYDRLVSPAVLERARRDAERVYVGKEAGSHALTQEDINALIVAHARRGKRVARLKGGDPFIFGRGGEELAAVRAAGIPCTVVPGISAAIAAGAGAGIPLTHRGLSQSVTFATAHFASDDAQDWAALARSHHTVVYYMGVGNLEAIVDKLRAAGADADLPVAIVQQASLPGERVLRATLGTIAALATARGIAPPAVLITGRVAAFGAPGALDDLATEGLKASQRNVA